MLQVFEKKPQLLSFLCIAKRLCSYPPQISVAEHDYTLRWEGFWQIPNQVTLDYLFANIVHKHL